MASPLSVNSDPFPKRRGESRVEMLGGSVGEKEKADILKTMAAGGFANQSDGVRSVCLAYMKSPEIRALVELMRKGGELE